MSEDSKFKVGDRVCRSGKVTFHPDDGISPEPKYGAISDALASGKFIVTWDVGGEDRRTFLPEELVSQSDRETECSELEEEYDSFSEEVEKKVAEGAKLINEAIALAQKHGYELSEMYEEVRPLRDCIDNAGWSSSSLSC